LRPSKISVTQHRFNPQAKYVPLAFVSLIMRVSNSSGVDAYAAFSVLTFALPHKTASSIDILEII
jgi:hypothetical protein